MHRRIIARAFLSVIVALGMVVAPQLAGDVAASILVNVGSNINVSALSGNQAEPTVAVDPGNPQHIFVASNPGTTSEQSSDGGQHWNRFNIGTLTGGSAPCCDNVATFDRFGNLFLVRIGLGPNNAIGGGDDTIELDISTTGGTQGSFSILQIIDVGSIDQPTVTVGSGDIAGSGSVWVTWNNNGTIYARGARVTGLGAANVGTFIASESAPNSASVHGQFGDIAVGPAGQVTVTYQSNSQIFVNTDADGLGAGGFGAQVTVTSTYVAKFYRIPAQSGRTIDAEVGLAYDRSGGSHNGRLYMVYTNATSAGSSDTNIFVKYSNDNGASWSGAVRVNDDSTTNSQFLPHLALDQTTGLIALAWHDARNDAGTGGAGDTNGIPNDDAQLWGAVSTNGGASFSPNFQISAGTSNAAAAASGVDYGDYRWSNFVNGVFYPVWADNSNSTGDNPDGTLSRFDIYLAAVDFRPSITVSVTPAANANGWNNTDVAVGWTVTGADTTSGCADTTLTTETAGVSLTCTATNSAGTSSLSTRNIKIDKTIPSISDSASPAANSNGWNNTDVTVSFSCNDALSGIDSCSGPTTLTAEGAGQSVTGTAVDRAGNSASNTVSNINIDKTAPTVTYSGNAGTYTVDQTVAITCSATDSLSGVDTTTCADINGQAFTFGLGTHTYSATATDKAGNVGTGSTSFDVTVTFDSLCTVTQQFETKQGVATAMCATLAAAKAADASGNETAKAGQLTAYTLQVEAQRGKTLTDAQADLLISLAGAL